MRYRPANDAVRFVNPTFAVIQGKHEFDGRLPDWSEAGLKRNIEAVKHDPATLEGLARDRLGLVKEGETVFLIAPGNNPEKKYTTEQQP